MSPIRNIGASAILDHIGFALRLDQSTIVKGYPAPSKSRQNPMNCGKTGKGRAESQYAGRRKAQGRVRAATKPKATTAESR